MPTIRTTNNRRRARRSRAARNPLIQWTTIPPGTTFRVRGGTLPRPLSEATLRRIAGGIAKMVGSV